MAYQGFGRGIYGDSFAVRHFHDLGIPLLVASSFSKNFALYGERCGALQVACPDARQAATVLSQLQLTVRRNYSSPPTFGSRIVASVLGDAALRAQWEDELSQMRNRMRTMRELLHQELNTLAPQRDWDYLLKQQGMFSFTGLSAEQVATLRQQHGVYLIETGRLCVAALTKDVLPYVAQAIATLS
jgi:aromatic-amino-acid transaminase